MQRAAIPALFPALLTSGCSDADAPRYKVQTVISDCYTSSVVQVAVDGRALALVPAAQRDDSLGVCYDEPLALGHRTRVTLRSQGQDRQIVLSPNAQSRFLVITPGRAPYAQLARNAPLLD